MDGTGAPLATELDRLLAMARELEARVDGDQGAPGAARELCAALAASVDRAMRLVDSPRGCDGEGNVGGRVSVNGQPRSGGRKAGKAVRTQVRVATVQDVGPLDDGLSWRKYGQKDILGATYPRSYFRCTHRHTQGCQATKQVQRAAGDPLLFDVVYHGTHTCAQAGGQQQQSPQSQQSPPSFAQEQQWQSTPEGIQWPVTPPSFPSSPAGTVGDCYPSAYHLAGGYGYGYAAGGGFGADMEFGSPLDEWFLNLPEFFHPEVQNL